MAVEIDAHWLEHFDGDVTSLLSKLGEDIVSDAKGKAPVKTGKLRDSISASVEDKTLMVSVGVAYGADVELGTREDAARPYLRPSVYKTRNL